MCCSVAPHLFLIWSLAMNEDDLDSIGFMFDAQHRKVVKTIEFCGGITITFKLIGDQPGHVQSGQYLWPAATAAGYHLIEHWEILKSENVIELGSGCGVTGLVSSKLSETKSVIFTDYDPGSLELIKENISLNENDRTAVCSEHLLEWGQPVPESVKQQHQYPQQGFKLILGSDLLYCMGVVEPLFRTVDELLCAEGGVFMLTTSFALDEVKQ